MDIEANPETGEWRIAGSQGAWMHIRDDPAKLLDSSVIIKPEPQLSAAAPAAAPQGGSFPHHALLVDPTHLQELSHNCAFWNTLQLIYLPAHPCLFPSELPATAVKLTCHAMQAEAATAMRSSRRARSCGRRRQRPRRTPSAGPPQRKTR